MLRLRARHLALPLALLLLFPAFAETPQAGLISGLLNTVTRLVDGALGVVLNNGMWTAQVPSGAFTGTATITMSVPSNNPRSCQLDILPLSKNGFSRPVVVTAKVGPTVTSDMRIEWWDPSSQVWVPVPGSSVNLAQGTVSAPLSHFSRYRVGGKSGW